MVAVGHELVFGGVLDALDFQLGAPDGAAQNAFNNAVGAEFDGGLDGVW